MGMIEIFHLPPFWPLRWRHALWFIIHIDTPWTDVSARAEMETIRGEIRTILKEGSYELTKLELNIGRSSIFSWFQFRLIFRKKTDLMLFKLKFAPSTKIKWMCSL
jgi:hypothetical protein